MTPEEELATFACTHERMTGIRVFYPSGDMGQMCEDCGIGFDVFGDIVEGLVGS